MQNQTITGLNDKVNPHSVDSVSDFWAIIITENFNFLLWQYELFVLQKLKKEETKMFINILWSTIQKSVND